MHGIRVWMKHAPPAIDGLEQHRVSLEHQIHLLRVKAVVAEIVANQATARGQVGRNVALQQRAHCLRNVLGCLPATVLCKGYETGQIDGVRWAGVG